jgi:hypothetical protein
VHGIGFTDEDSLDIASDALRNGMHIDVPQGTCFCMVQDTILTILPAHATS